MSWGLVLRVLPFRAEAHDVSSQLLPTSCSRALLTALTPSFLSDALHTIGREVSDLHQSVA